MSLLEQTLALAALVAPRNRTFLITADIEAMGRAQAHGVSVIADHANDLNEALSEGRQSVLLQPALANQAGLLILPIDLPLATRTSVMKVVNECDVALARDSRGSGTNLLALRGNAVADFPFSFGANSFVRHCDTARRSGHSLLIVNDPTLALDLDTAEDYKRLSRVKRDTVQMAS